MKLKKLQLLEPYNLILHYVVCHSKFFLQFELLDFDPCLKNHTPIFFMEHPLGPLYSELTFIVTMKYELYIEG